MASPEHLEILLAGVDTWNRWRKEHPTVEADLTALEPTRRALRLTDDGLCDMRGMLVSPATMKECRLLRVDLSGSDLSAVTLRECYVSGSSLAAAALKDADLSGSRVRLTTLTKANLEGAHLHGAELGKCSLKSVVLRNANLGGATIRRCDLGGSDFTGAVMGDTNLLDLDLSGVVGLDEVLHAGPSSIGVDTLLRSNGRIPEVFLRGCGVPNIIIEYAASLVGKPIEFYSCFVSYSTKDDQFAQQLYSDLQSKGVRCWRFPESARWGETVWGEIDRGIKFYDKLVLVLSEQSLQSGPVLRELERALQREDNEGREILFPIRLDDFVFDGWHHERKADVTRKVIGDFRNWKDHDAYQTAFERLLRDLKASEPKGI